MFGCITRIESGSICKAPRTGLGKVGGPPSRSGLQGPGSRAQHPIHGAILWPQQVGGALPPHSFPEPLSGALFGRNQMVHRLVVHTACTMPPPASEPSCNLCPLYGVQTPPLACHAPSQTTQYAQRVIFVHHHAPKGNSIPPYYGGGDRGSGKQQDFPAIKRRKPQSEHSSVQLPNQTVRDAKQPGSSDLAPHPQFLEGGQMFMQRREIISGYKTHSIPSLIALREKTLPQSLGPFPSFPDLRLSMFPDSHHSLIHSFIYPFIHPPVHPSTH